MSSNEVNATTYDLTEKESAFSVLSDVFKEINGWRPRSIYSFDHMTIGDIYTETDRLYNEEVARKAAVKADEARIAAKRVEACTPTPLVHNPFAALLG